jgi:hypothetical protein
MDELLLWFVATYRFNLLQHLYVLQKMNHLIINIIIIYLLTNIVDTMPIQFNRKCKTIQHIEHKHTDIIQRICCITISTIYIIHDIICVHSTSSYGSKI